MSDPCYKCATTEHVVRKIPNPTYDTPLVICLDESACRRRMEDIHGGPISNLAMSAYLRVGMPAHLATWKSLVPQQTQLTPPCIVEGNMSDL